jgi:hypothetical protein
MARIRTIKPELFASPQVMNITRDARLLFIGLISQADDEGRGSADPRKLKAAVFGGDDDLTCGCVLEMLKEIEGQGLCITYDGGTHGKLYALPSWRQHQSLDRPRKSVYPASPLVEASTKDRRILDESSTTTREGSKRNEPNLTQCHSERLNPALQRSTGDPPSPRTKNKKPRANGNGAEEPKTARLARALELHEKQPNLAIGDIAKLMHLTVADLREAFGEAA